jgi:preprotein translocase subunit SecF
MTELTKHILENFKEFAAATSLLLTILGAVSAMLAKSGTQWFARTRGIKIELQKINEAIEAHTLNSDKIEEILENLPVAAEIVYKGSKTRDSASKLGNVALEVARGRVVARIAEVNAFRTAQDKKARISSWSSNLLTVAQYVIGGVLASSFVQESLTPKWVGALGVLVLVASLFKQQFHPEIDAEQARKKSAQAVALVRSSEDRLAILDAKTSSGEDHSDAMAKLMTEITQGLNEVENTDSTRGHISTN